MSRQRPPLNRHLRQIESKPALIDSLKILFLFQAIDFFKHTESDRQLFAPLFHPSFDYIAAGGGAHALSESVHARSSPFFRLISSFAHSAIFNIRLIINQY